MAIRKIRSIVKDQLLVSRLVRGRSFLRCSPQLSLSDACNYRCAMCWIHSDLAERSTNPERTLFLQSKPQILKYDDFVRIVDGLHRANVKQVDLCGKGEPCLNPHFIEMCQYLDYRDIPFRLTTNGSLLGPEMSSSLIKRHVFSISISLNAADERTFVLINKPKDATSLNRVVKNISHLREIRNQLGSNTKIQVRFVISKMNIDTICEMIRLGLLLGDNVVFMNAAIYDQIDQIALDMKDYDNMVKIFDEFRNQDRLIGVKHFLRKVRQSAVDHRYFLTELFETQPCRIPFGFAVIHADGRVTPCCPSYYICGNAIETGFERLWNSKEFRQFRMEALALPEKREEASKSYCYCCDHY
ncbi:MAG: radical SAM protein [Candidatus Eisenbacteria bacterium]|nr:radical SAM protein [Candidatus Eisenbacteria bacterium]